LLPDVPVEFLTTIAYIVPDVSAIDVAKTISYHWYEVVNSVPLNVTESKSAPVGFAVAGSLVVQARMATVIVPGVPFFKSDRCTLFIL
jgi:hypothetical protein